MLNDPYLTEVHLINQAAKKKNPESGSDMDVSKSMVREPDEEEIASRSRSKPSKLNKHPNVPKFMGGPKTDVRNSRVSAKKMNHSFKNLPYSEPENAYYLPGCEPNIKSHRSPVRGPSKDLSKSSIDWHCSHHHGRFSSQKRCKAERMEELRKSGELIMKTMNNLSHHKQHNCAGTSQKYKAMFE